MCGGRRGRPIPRIANTSPNAMICRLVWGTLHSEFNRNGRFYRGSATDLTDCCRVIPCFLLTRRLFVSEVVGWWPNSSLRVGSDLHVFELLFDSAGFALISRCWPASVLLSI